MTTEEDFQSALDRQPDDWQTRLVFADWLQERGDPRAEGYRLFGTHRMHPLLDLRTHVEHNWYYHSGKSNVLADHRTIATLANYLPQDWIDMIKNGGFHNSNNDLWVGYSTSRREVEDAAALAFAHLPADRRAELFTAITPPPADKAPKRKRKR